MTISHGQSGDMHEWPRPDFTCFFSPSPGDHLLIAMQKQHGESASQVDFPQATMVRVDAPASKDYLFQLPDSFAEDDLALYPLMDSHGKVSALICLDKC